MPQSLLVGDLTIDPTASSFISVEEADRYLAPELHAEWLAADVQQRAAALVRASRWLAMTFRWRILSQEDLARVGLVAARLAAETVTVHIFKGASATGAVQSERFGEVSFTYRTDLVADAAGLSWDWLEKALAGLIGDARPLGLGVLVV